MRSHETLQKILRAAGLATVQLTNGRPLASASDVPWRMTRFARVAACTSYSHQKHLRSPQSRLLRGFAGATGQGQFG